MESLLKSLPIIKEWIIWRVIQGIHVHIGMDPIVDFTGNYQYSNAFISMLHSTNIQVLF